MLGVRCKDGTNCAGGGMSGQDQHCWEREVRTGPVLLGCRRWGWDQNYWGVGGGGGTSIAGCSVGNLCRIW
jgi:hypothetical protein